MRHQLSLEVPARGALRSRSAGILAALLLALPLALVAGRASATSDLWNVAIDPSDGFGGRTTGWLTGEPTTAIAAWNAVNAYPIDTTPDEAAAGFDMASLAELTGAAFLTGSGNTYNFSAASSFRITLTGTGLEGAGVRTVALRIETLGSALDLASVSLTAGGGAPLLATSADRLHVEVLGGPGGNEEEWLFLFEGVSGGSLVADFAASGPHLSLAQTALLAGPLAAVPEPGSVTLLILGLGGLAAAGRRRG